jgi:hypothetical protein
MSDAAENIEQWRRSLAGEAFNGAWELIDQTARTPEDDREMLVRAVASRYLWEGVWQIAHALSWWGEGALALRFAEAALQRAEQKGWSDWRRASCLEGMARAHAVAGDASQRDRYAMLCEEVLGTLEDLEDRDLIASQLATVPGLRRHGSAGEDVPPEPHPEQDEHATPDGSIA